MYIHPGDSETNEHEDKTNGDFGHGISATNGNGSKNCEDKTRATVFQSKVSCAGMSEPNKYSGNSSWIAIDTCATVSVSGQKIDFPTKN